MTPDYYREVSDAYLRLAGRGLTLSPRDIELVSRWWRAQVPAPVVVRGLENAFAHVGSRKVRSLAFALSAVDEAIKGWQSRQAGSAQTYETQPQTDWENAFGSLISRLDLCRNKQADQGLRQLVESARSGVEEIRSRWRNEPNFELMSAMEELEDTVCHRALDAIGPLERIRLESEIASVLDQEKSLSASVREDTRKAFLRKRVRKTLELPPLEIQLGGGWS